MNSNTNLRSNKVDRLTTKQVDLNGRRTSNAGDAIDAQDYVTLKQLKDLLNGVTQNVTQNTTVNNNSTTITTTATFDYHTLTANYTLNAAVFPPPAGGILVVIFTQDGTGGWVVTFNAAHFSLTPSTINRKATKRTALIFGNDNAGKWMLISTPMLEG